MRIITLAFVFCLCVKLSAQSIEYRLFIEPVSNTLASNLDIITVPIHDYKIESISKPYYGLELVRTTKHNWGYGIRFAHWHNAKYISFDYRIPSDTDPYAWNYKNNSRSYKISHISSSLVFQKTMNKYKISIGTGIVGSNNAWSGRHQIDRYSHGTVLYGSNDLYIYKVGGVRVQSIGRHWTGLFVVSTMRFEYELKNNVHMGISVKYMPRSHIFAELRSWEVESYNIEDENTILADLEGVDKSNDTAEIWVREDKLKLGFSIGYQFNRKLKQKRKKRRKEAKTNNQIP